MFEMAAHSTDGFANGRANGHANGQPNGKDLDASQRFERFAEKEATDINCWRLLDERGRQTWHYLDSPEKIEQWPQGVVDRHHLGLPLVREAQHHTLSQMLH